MLKTETLSLMAAALLGLAGLTGCAAVIPVQASSTDEPTVQARDRSALSARAEAKLGTSCENGTIVRTAYYWQGRHTASGQRFDPEAMTAAHRTLPFGTKLTVTNPRTGKTVEVVVNDRGPFTRGLHLDLSRGAARAIGLNSTGTVCVT
jgi:peptidoglycan lytic transglycosylase